VRQLHFHLPNAVSFLRFHRPSKYGDSLVGVRKDIEYVNKVQKIVRVFEEGRIFNGFRNIYPLFAEGAFVGTVEVSYSFLAMEDELCEVDDDSSYLFLLKNNVIAKKVFQGEKTNYQASPIKGYSYDTATLKKDMTLSTTQLDQINRLIAKKAEQIMQKEEASSFLFQNKNVIDNEPLMVTFLPVKNIDNRTVAYIVVYDLEPSLQKMQAELIISFVLIIVIGLVFSLLFLMLLQSERKKYELIKTFATHDALTGIYNRYRINELLEMRIAEAKRYKKPLSIIFFDIDFFKKVNDTYGHEMGDVVLREIAQLIASELRASDVFARWGGEEFIILLPETKLEAATKVAQKLRKKIEEYKFTGLPQQVTCSFGVTQLREDDDEKSLFKRVDALLYRAKNSGRNKVVSG
jgi:diguanylate cyclase (GGDEF)-like protein